MKRLALSVLTKSMMLPLAYPATRGAASVLVLHRFADPSVGTDGHSPEALRAKLAFLRRHRFNIVSAPDLVASLEHGEPPRPKTVAFTLDDGYGDFARVGCGVFAEFDCPVTVFVVTGFLDGNNWMWWDKVELAITQTQRTAVTVRLGVERLAYTWRDANERSSAKADLVARLKAVNRETRRAVIASFARALDVEVPASPPARYAPMNWDEARQCARRGVLIGPHSVTHPILARETDQSSVEEMRESWKRVREEVPGAVPLLAYPDGAPGSSGARERSALAEMGVKAAFTTVPGYVSHRLFSASPGAGRYALPRFPYYDSAADFRQVVSGLERVKRWVRGTPDA